MCGAEPLPLCSCHILQFIVGSVTDHVTFSPQDFTGPLPLPFLAYEYGLIHLYLVRGEAGRSDTGSHDASRLHSAV